MAALALTLKASVAWWVRPYLLTLALFCATFGTSPDQEKVQRTILRGIRVRVEG